MTCVIVRVIESHAVALRSAVEKTHTYILYEKHAATMNVGFTMRVRVRIFRKYPKRMYKYTTTARLPVRPLCCVDVGIVCVCGGRSSTQTTIQRRRRRRKKNKRAEKLKGNIRRKQTRDYTMCNTTLTRIACLCSRVQRSYRALDANANFVCIYVL